MKQIFDKTDLKIIKELDSKPKISISEISKKLRKSQQSVDYRVKQLIKKGIIQSFGTIINVPPLGYGQYRVFFTFGNIDEKRKKEIITYFEKNKKVYWASVIGGKWDLMVCVFVKNYTEFDEFIGTVFEKFRDGLTDYESYYVLYQEFYRHKFLLKESFGSTVIDFADVGEQIKLDKLDMQILHLTKTDARISALEIGRKLGVSYKTIINRIKRLEKDKVILGYRFRREKAAELLEAAKEYHAGSQVLRDKGSLHTHKDREC
jgi:DNA-binding Lrp family transcriptional regulator